MGPGEERLSIEPLEAGLALVGEVDLETVGQLHSHLAGIEATSETLLDLAGVTFLDSSGLRILVDAHHQRETAGGRLVFSRPSDVVVRLLEITGLLDRLHVVQADEC